MPTKQELEETLAEMQDALEARSGDGESAALAEMAEKLKAAEARAVAAETFNRGKPKQEYPKYLYRENAEKAVAYLADNAAAAAAGKTNSASKWYDVRLVKDAAEHATVGKDWADAMPPEPEAR